MPDTSPNRAVRARCLWVGGGVAAPLAGAGLVGAEGMVFFFVFS